MRICVTGGAGFIGSHVVDQLLAEGHDVVVVFDKTKPGNLAHAEDAVRWVHGDLRRLKDCRAAVQDVDAVIHMAALINVDHSIRYPLPFYETNVGGTMKLLNAVRLEPTVKKLVYMSTAEVYGHVPTGRVAETANVDPRSPYAGSKYAGERCCLSFWHTYHHPEITVVRGANTFGPRQTAGGKGAVHAIFIVNRLKGRSITVFGTGTQERDYLYVEDMAKGVVAAALTRDIGGEVINVASGDTLTVNQIAYAAISAVSRPDDQEVRHIAARQGEVLRSCLDPAKAARLLHWHPATSYLAGLRRTVAAYHAAIYP